VWYEKHLCFVFYDNGVLNGMSIRLRVIEVGEEQDAAFMVRVKGSSNFKTLCV
jgi:hypothetical protein